MDPVVPEPFIPACLTYPSAPVLSPLIVADTNQAEFSGAPNTREANYTEVSAPDQRWGCQELKPSHSLQHPGTAVLTKGSHITGNLSYTEEQLQLILVAITTYLLINITVRNVMRITGQWQYTVPLILIAKQEINPNEKLIIDF